MPHTKHQEEGGAFLNAVVAELAHAKLSNNYYSCMYAHNTHDARMSRCCLRCTKCAGVISCRHCQVDASRFRLVSVS